MTMFWSQLNGVWSKIISITMSLVAGNVQLLSVVKFVRFALFAYPEEHVRYHRRYVVFGSVLLWFATAFSISLCGVKQTSSTSSTSRTTEQDRVKHCQSAPEDGHVIVQTTNGILKSSSGDTQITRDLTTNEILNSSSGDTQILRGLEEGAIGLSASSVEGTIVTDGTDNIEGIEVELSMSASGEGTLASF